MADLNNKADYIRARSDEHKEERLSQRFAVTKMRLAWKE